MSCEPAGAHGSGRIKLNSSSKGTVVGRPGDEIERPARPAVERTTPPARTTRRGTSLHTSTTPIEFPIPKSQPSCLGLRLSGPGIHRRRRDLHPGQLRPRVRGASITSPPNPRQTHPPAGPQRSHRACHPAHRSRAERSATTAPVNPALPSATHRLPGPRG